MNTSNRSGVRISIRSKLVLVSLTLLIIPWIGTHYIQEMEDYLRQQQEQALLTRTETVASILQGKPEWFSIQTNSPLPTRSVHHFYVRPLRSAMQLDGYLDDWQTYRDRIQHFDQNASVYGNEHSRLAFDMQVGSFGKYLYVALRVKDSQVIYRRPGSADREDCDHILIAIENKDGEFSKYVISSISPGWVNGYRILPRDLDDEPSYETEIRIRGEWQEFPGGYTVEVRIPSELIGAKISFAVADVIDKRTRKIDSLVTTAGMTEPSALATIVFPSPEVETLLQGLQRSLTRTWVIDKHYRVIAQTGELTKPEQDNPAPDAAESLENKPALPSRIISAMYGLLLKQPSSEFHDELLNASRLDSEEFRRALVGEPNTRWRQTSDKDVNILTAAHPVFNNGNVIGAIAIEQTSNSILLLQNRAMEILFNISALAFLVATTVLLAFATRLSWRVRRLRDSAEAAITVDGRVTGPMPVHRASDEIGDLSRSFADMLSRLSQYNRYLESMSSKLSHELRTPITVVRSSLDNLENADMDDQSRAYIERAREGINRLSHILTRMSEATRLEQSIQNEPRKTFDLVPVLRGCVEGYRAVHPDMTFDLHIHTDTLCSVLGSPDFIAQMLDKLINNAIDFHRPGTPISVTLHYQDDNWLLRVQNEGPALPTEMQHHLFDSMVSVRTQTDREPHLGLGLYIVRLIAEFHHAKVAADNLADGRGVVFTVTLPIAQPT